MSKQPGHNIHAGPVAPTIGFVLRTRVDRTDGKTTEHWAWIQDIEDRRNRAAEFEAKRQQVKPKKIRVELSTIDKVLIAVDEAIKDFEGPNGYGKPNQPLIDAKIEADRLRRELAEAR
jgi:hypothetical protein